MINIEGLDKGEILRQLYNNAKWQGFGIIQFDPRDMGIEEATMIIKKQTYFDYFLGRSMKVDLESDIEFEEYLYDRDNGEGVAQQVIDSIREQMGKENSTS